MLLPKLPESTFMHCTVMYSVLLYRNILYILAVPQHTAHTHIKCDDVLSPRCCTCNLHCILHSLTAAVAIEEARQVAGHNAGQCFIKLNLGARGLAGRQSEVPGQRMW